MRVPFCSHTCSLNHHPPLPCQIHVQRVSCNRLERAQLLLPLRQRGRSPRVRRAFELVPLPPLHAAVFRRMLLMPPPPPLPHRNFKIFEAAPQNERGAPAKKPPPDYFL